MKPKGTLKICDRGHKFYKSSSCLTCPKCEKMNLAENLKKGDFPENLSAPAFRALQSARIHNLSDLKKFAEKEVANLHGMGPKGIRLLKESLKKKDISFKE